MLPQIVALVIVEKSFNAQLPTSYMGNSITPVFCTTFEINQRASSYSLHCIGRVPVYSTNDPLCKLCSCWSKKHSRLVKIRIHFKYRGKFICCFFFKINFIAASCDCAKVKDITTLLVLANPVQRP